MILLILYFALAVALVGTLSSAVFLALALLGVIRFRVDAGQQLRSVPDDAHLPPVSVLKPVHGLEARLKENIESFFQQDYPNYEILFAADEANDAALDVVRIPLGIADVMIAADLAVGAGPGVLERNASSAAVVCTWKAPVNCA